MLKTIWEDIEKIKSTPKQLREFGIVMAVFFGVVSFLLRRKGGHFETPALIASAFLLFGLIAPKLLLPLQKVWMTIAVVIGFFMSHIILGVLYFFLMTPMALIARLTGKKFLSDHKQLDTSYWIEHPKIKDKTSYQNQY